MKFMGTRLSAITAAAFAGVVALTTLTTTTDAVAASSGPVSTTPAGFTPWLPSSAPGQHIQQLVQCGGTMYAAGKIGTVNQGASTYSRGNAFSFSATSGAMTSWDPKVNGTVYSIALSPDCKTAYLGGVFSAANGQAAKNLVAVNATTGAVTTGFAHSANAAVETVKYANGSVIVGGGFTSVNGTKRTMLASLNPSTGAVTGFVNLTLSGGYPNSPATRLYNSQLNHAGTKLLIEGVFTSVGGQPRQQIAMLDLAGASATVDGWYPVEFNGVCSANANYYAKGANWSPDDSTVYVATTGYKPTSGAGSSTIGPRGGLCDAAIAFPAASAPVTHTWINYTGCDSLFAVASDTNDVYVGGHERYADNGNGCDGAGPGAVSRPGIGAVSPTTGLATAWNPTRSRGHGVNDLLLTTAGLWVASDNGASEGASQMCGHKTNKGGLCFLPY